MRQPIIYPLDDDGYKPYENVVSDQIKMSINDMNFKSNPVYCGVLEHVNQGYGYQYLECIAREFPESLDKLKKFLNLNDKHGQPIKYDFATQDQQHYHCSPTSFRYFYQALLVLKHIKELGLNSVDIVEIGGGYGGLCLALHYLSTDINSYSICDLL